MRRPLKLVILGWFACVLLQSADALAQKRVALVIGNSGYTRVKPLPNPANDAAAFGDLLRKSGFEVVDARTNASGAEMRRALREFSDHVRGADTAVVYFAGHGMEIDGTNFLLPVDAALERDIDVDDEAISLDRILKIMEPARRLRLVIVDACRDNPFVTAMRRTSVTRAIGRGLARIEPPNSDTLVAYATKAGLTADDVDGPHSPFTQALLKHIAVPGLDLRLAFGRIRDEVLSRTNNRQEPSFYGSLGGTTVSLVPSEPVAPPVAAKPPLTSSDPVDRMRRDYELAVQINTKEIWNSFLNANKSGFYADLARAQLDRILTAEQEKLAALQRQPASPQPSATPPPSSVVTPPVAPPAAVAAPAPLPPPAAVAPATTAPSPAPLQPLAVLTTPSGPASAPPVDPGQTTIRIQAELKRVGCYPGPLSGAWGADSQRAMESFNRHSGLKLETKLASLEAVDVLRAKPTRVCPLQCGQGFRADGEACVRITCPRGQVLGDNGRCERRETPRTAAKPPAQRAEPAAKRQAPKADGAPAQVVCGQTGCFPVKKGCRGEVRPSGNSEVAVVSC